MSDDRLYPLYKLSRVDIELAAIRGRAGGLDTGKRHRAKAKLVQEENSEMLGELQAKREALAQAMADLEQSRARYQRDYDRLYSGAITNPREIQALQHELESLEKHVQELEPRIAQLTEERDAMAVQAEEVETLIQRLLRKASKLRKEAEEERSRLEETFNALAHKRKAMAAALPGALRDPYEVAHRKTKAGGLALITPDRKCEGCGTAVPEKSIERTREGALTSCENCSRLLFLLMPSAEANSS